MWKCYWNLLRKRGLSESILEVGKGICMQFELIHTFSQVHEESHGT